MVCEVFIESTMLATLLQPYESRVLGGDLCSLWTTSRLSIHCIFFLSFLSQLFECVQEVTLDLFLSFLLCFIW